jgi:hypothetical protein
MDKAEEFVNAENAIRALTEPNYEEESKKRKESRVDRKGERRPLKDSGKQESAWVKTRRQSFMSYNFSLLMPRPWKS